jgi:membrane protease YdiL (CAAX protease family)
VPGLLAPALAALVVTGAVDGRAGVRALAARVLRWRMGGPAALVAVAPALGFAALAAAGFTGSASDLGRMNGFPITTAGALFAFVLLANGVGEELGWRGFAHARLRRRHGPLAASLAVAPVWALWHVPLFGMLEGYGGFHAGTLVGFAVRLAGASIVLGWVYDRSGGSVLASALFHTTFNLCTATPAAHGVPAAVLTSAVMIVAVGMAIAGSRGRGAIGVQCRRGTRRCDEACRRQAVWR